MIEFLVVIVLVLAIFALVAAIWGKDTAKGCAGFTASCGLQLLLAALAGLVLGVVGLILLNLTGVLR